MAETITDTLLLCLVFWTFYSQKNRIELLEQSTLWCNVRAERQRLLLVVSAVHIRTLAKAISMIEMHRDSERVTVNVKIDSFAKDNLYWLTEQLEEYTPVDAPPAHDPEGGG